MSDQQPQTGSGDSRGRRFLDEFPMPAADDTGYFNAVSFEEARRQLTAAELEDSQISAGTQVGDNVADQANARNSRVGRNSAVMAIGSMGSRVLGFVRTFVFVLVLQSSLSADAFTIANDLPTTIYLLLSTGVITSVLIPQIARAMRMPDGGDDFVNRLLTLAFLILSGVTVVATVAVPLLMRMLVSADAAATPGFMRLAVFIGFLCMPQLLFYGVYAILGQVLNARGHFTAYAWAPAWANVVQIAGLLLFYFLWGPQPEPAGFTWPMIIVLAGSTTLGIALQGLVLVAPLIRDGFRFKFTTGWRGYGFGKVSQTAIWTMVAATVTVFNSWICTHAMNASRAGDASLAGNTSNSLAYQLFMVPYSLITTSVLVAVFPALAQAWRDADLPAFRKLVKRGMLMPATLVIPASAALIFLGMPIVRVLFWRLSYESAEQVWIIMAIYALATVPMGITGLQNRYYFAQERGAMYFMFICISNGIQITSAFLAMFVVPGRYGVITIAIGTLLGVVVSSIVFFVLAHRQIGNYGLGEVFRTWGRLYGAAICAGVLAWALSSVLTDINGAHWFQIPILIIGGLVYVGVFVAASYWLHLTEVTDYIDTALKKVRSLRHAD